MVQNTVRCVEPFRRGSPVAGRTDGRTERRASLDKIGQKLSVMFHYCTLIVIVRLSYSKKRYNFLFKPMAVGLADESEARGNKVKLN